MSQPIETDLASEGGRKVYGQVDDYDPVEKHQNLDHRERYFSPLQDLQKGLMLDAGGLYRLNGDEQGGRKRQDADFGKGQGGMHWQEAILVGDIGRLDQKTHLDGKWRYQAALEENYSKMSWKSR